MEVNIKYMIRYLICFIIGISLIIYGIMEIVSSKYAQPPLSDKQIIQRAKDLGMVELKDALISDKNSSEIVNSDKINSDNAD